MEFFPPTTQLSDSDELVVHCSLHIIATDRIIVRYNNSTNEKIIVRWKADNGVSAESTAHDKNEKIKIKPNDKAAKKTKGTT